MGIEVEIRTICNNPIELEKKLSSLFPIVKTKHQVDEYFLHPLRDFYSNPSFKEYLRIRIDGQKTVLAYHKAFLKDGKKTHTEEHELLVENYSEMKSVLESLSFKPFVTVTKERKVFDAGDFELCFDYIKELGYFLEVEAKKDFGGIDKTTQECFNFLKKIGADFIPAPNMGYPDMVAEKIQKK